jgi:hypothetical protein
MAGKIGNPPTFSQVPPALRGELPESPPSGGSRSRVLSQPPTTPSEPPQQRAPVWANAATSTAQARPQGASGPLPGKSQPSAEGAPPLGWGAPSRTAGPARRRSRPSGGGVRAASPRQASVATAPPRAQARPAGPRVPQSGAAAAPPARPEPRTAPAPAAAPVPATGAAPAAAGVSSAVAAKENVASPATARAPAEASAAATAPPLASAQQKAEIEGGLADLERLRAQSKNGTLGRLVTEWNTAGVFGSIEEGVDRQVAEAAKTYAGFTAAGPLTAPQYQHLRTRIDDVRRSLGETVALRNDNVDLTTKSAVGGAALGAALVAVPVASGAGAVVAGAAKVGGALAGYGAGLYTAMMGRDATPEKAASVAAQSFVQGSAGVVGGALAGELLTAAGGAVAASTGLRAAAEPVTAALKAAGTAAPVVRKVAGDAVAGGAQGAGGGGLQGGLTQALEPGNWSDGVGPGLARVANATGDGVAVGALVGSVAGPVAGAVSRRPAGGPRGAEKTPGGAEGAPPAALPAAEKGAGSGTPVPPPASAQPAGLPVAGPGAGVSLPASPLGALTAQENELIAAARARAFVPENHQELRPDFETVRRLAGESGKKRPPSAPQREELAAARQRLDEARGRALAAPLTPKEQAVVLGERLRGLDPSQNVSLRADLEFVKQPRPTGVSAREVAFRAKARQEAQARLDQARADLDGFQKEVRRVLSPDRVEDRGRLLAQAGTLVRQLNP